MTDEQRIEEAWKERSKLKFDPLPLDEIAKCEFQAGVQWARSNPSPAVMKMYEFCKEDISARCADSFEEICLAVAEFEKELGK